MSEGTPIDSAERSPLRRARLPLVLVGFVVLLGLASAIGVRNTESWSSLEHLSERVLARWVPPAVGDESQLDPSAERALARLGRRLSGRLMWSSNRSGNHEIWMLELPGLERRRLTDHPHVDFFPRFSPDGSRILFQRSREEYVSGRDHRGWDLYIVELAAAGATASAETMPQPRRLAERAFRPAWAPDGRSIVFSRNLRIFRVDVASGVESQLFEPPEGFPAVRQGDVHPAPDGRRFGVSLDGGGTRVYSLSDPASPAVAGFLDRDSGVDGRRESRRRQRADSAPPPPARGTVAAVDLGLGSPSSCQVSWGPDAGTVLWVQAEGRGGTRIMRTELATGGSEIFVDLPGDYSHEYFPRLGNNADWLVWAAAAEGHEHDHADYEIFVWRVGTPWKNAVRVTHYTGNDMWPDLFIDPR